MGAIEKEVGVHAVANWFLSCTIENTENQVVFYAPNQFSLDYMKQKFMDNLEHIRVVFKGLQIELRCQEEAI